jgi:endonuclease-3 related protein
MPGSLTTVYTRLREHFGSLHGAQAQRQWWPIISRDPPFEMLVGAVLVQQTRWETVEQVVARLHTADLLSTRALAQISQETLSELLKPAAFYRQKAPGIITIAGHIVNNYAGDTSAMLARPTLALREELLALPQIGPETADVVMLYGGNHNIFVVDEYTRRLFERVRPTLDHNRSAPWRTSYHRLQQKIEAQLTPDPTQPIGATPAARSAFYADYHALINEQCVRYCLARPRCDGPPARRVYSRQAGREAYLDRQDGCPLRDMCGFYRERVHGSAVMSDPPGGNPKHG